MAVEVRLHHDPGGSMSGLPWGVAGVALGLFAGFFVLIALGPGIDRADIEFPPPPEATTSAAQ